MERVTGDAPLMLSEMHAAIAVIGRTGRLLVCQRKAADSLGGYWEFPGGGLQDGETLSECLHRELREELNITVRIIRPLNPVVHQTKSERLILHPFLCDSIDREPTAIECDQFHWIDPLDLPRYRFPPGNETMIAEAIAAIIAMDRAD